MDARNFFTYDTSSPTAGIAGFTQLVTAAAISVNVIDLDVAGISPVNPTKGPYLVIKVGAVDLATTVSMEIKLLSDTAAALTGAPTVVQMWRFLLADMTAGSLLVNQMLPPFDYQRYLGLEFTPFTNNTAGGFIGYLADGPEPVATAPDNEEAGS